MYRLVVNLSKYIRWLSLDIALGGAILLYFVVEHIYHLPLPGSVVLELMLSILIIYTADHLQDALRITSPVMPRHQFHQKYKKLLFLYLIALSLAGIVVLFYLPVEVLISGMGIALLSILYLVVNQRLSRRGIKELVVSVVYATAMFLLPFLHVSIDIIDIVRWLQLVFLAFANLMILSVYEHQLDQKDKTTSIAHMLGVPRSKWIIYLILSINLMLSIYFFHFQNDYALFVILCSLMLFTVLYFQSVFEKNERYRWMSDMIFFIPILLI